MSSDQLRLLSLCAYLTDSSNKWRSEDYTASMMVKALKGIPFKGYFTTEIAGKAKRFDQSNAHQFVERIPRAMARMIARYVDGPATIVPIPNSHVTSARTPNFKTYELAQAVAENSNGQFSAAPALVFATPQKKSHKGGTRDPHYLEDVYRIATELEGPIVLLDDVCTTGGHIIAAHRKLEFEDGEVLLAASFGRSTKQQIRTPVGIHEEMLDLSDQPSFAEQVRRLLNK